MTDGAARRGEEIMYGFMYQSLTGVALAEGDRNVNGISDSDIILCTQASYVRLNKILNA